MFNSSLAFAEVLVASALALLAILQATGRNENPQKVFAIAFSALAISFLLFIAQSKVPQWLGVIIADVLIINAHVFFSFAFRLSDQHPDAWPSRYWVYELAAVLSLVFFTYIVPDFNIRGCIISFIISIALGECILVLVRGYQNIPVRVRYPIIIIFGLFILCHLARICLFFFYPEHRLMDANIPTAFTFSFTIFFSVICSGMFLLIDSSCLIDRLNKTNRLLETMALRDELTGVLNRHSLDQTVAAEMDRQDRYHAPLSLIMFDLDHFKSVNDLHGHDAGDMVLAETTARVGKNIRDTDYFFRWGGEEFFILLPNVSLAGAALLAEKLRVTIAESEFSPAGTITASFGIAERLPGERREDWFKRVDQAMYRAKALGRNRVEA